MNTYIAFYKGQQLEIKADTTLQAQTIAAAKFGARKAWDVTVILAAKADGVPIVHQPQEICA